MEKKEGASAAKVIDLPNAMHKGHLMTKPAGASGELQGKQKSASLRNKVVIIASVIAVLLVLAWFFVVFLPNQYRFSFNVDGVAYFSNVNTPNDFFQTAKDSNNFIVSVDLLNGSPDPWQVNSMNLWLIALNSSKKHTVSVIKTVNSGGDVNSCLTNDGNVLSSRALSKEDCIAVLSDDSFYKINLHQSSEEKVVLSQGNADIFSQGRTGSMLNYLVISNIYPDFNRTIQIANEKINSVK